MKSILLILLLAPLSLMAQTPEAVELVRIQEALTTSDMNGITGVERGALIFNVEKGALFYYDGSKWINTQEVSSSGTITIPANPVSGGNLSNPNATVANQNFTVTGLPFRPSRVEFVAYANVDAVNLNADNQVGNNNNTLQNSFGYMTGFAQNSNGTITQQVISGGGNGNSINDISRFASNSHCIGIRYGNQNGDQVGLLTASMVSFNSDGFTISSNRRDDALVIIYTAYK